MVRRDGSTDVRFFFNSVKSSFDLQLVENINN